MGYRKNLTNPYLYRQFSNNPVEMFNHTMTNLMDNFYDNALTDATDGSFKAVCLSGIRTEDNTTSGTDIHDARKAGKYVELIVRPLTAFGGILPDPALITDPTELDSIIDLHASTFIARSDFEFKDTDVPKFGQIINCYYEEGSIINSDFRGLRFSKPTGEEISPDYKKLATLEKQEALKDQDWNNSSLLGEDVGPPLPELATEQGKSTNIKGDRTKPIEYIVIHYSAAIGSKEAVLKNENTNTNYGYHFMVDRDGSFYESAPTSKKVQHIGSQSGVVNSNSVGLCIMNVGFDRSGITDSLLGLNKQIPPKSSWVLGEFPNTPDGSQVNYSGGNGKWEPYTNASLVTAARLCAKVLKDNNLTVDRVVGHSDIQTDKSDPGPAFDMNGFRRMIQANMSV